MASRLHSAACFVLAAHCLYVASARRSLTALASGISLYPNAGASTPEENLAYVARDAGTTNANADTAPGAVVPGRGQGVSVATTRTQIQSEAQDAIATPDAGADSPDQSDPGGTGVIARLN
ncbi:hypothetical protein WJX75_008907 [Coccomyxa subellipsoidea]|uniref:Uncharacterized protein n=1 Tax=Coccomyxa subellipsoidea TaxID=248742 RepID=A0ABR2YYJ4_9CHLO